MFFAELENVLSERGVIKEDDVGMLFPLRMNPLAMVDYMRHIW